MTLVACSRSLAGAAARLAEAVELDAAPSHEHRVACEQAGHQTRHAGRLLLLLWLVADPLSRLGTPRRGAAWRGMAWAGVVRAGEV
jgi:hypothetical protein